jgi:hypothetical protein
MKNNYLAWEEGDGQHATIGEAYAAQLEQEAQLDAEEEQIDSSEE